MPILGIFAGTVLAALFSAIEAETKASEEELQPVYDDVIWMLHMRGRSVRQIAEELGASQQYIVDRLSFLERQRQIPPIVSALLSSTDGTMEEIQPAIDEILLILKRKHKTPAQISASLDMDRQYVEARLQVLKASSPRAPRSLPTVTARALPGSAWYSEARRLIDAGLSDDEIAEKINVYPGKIANVRREITVQPIKRPIFRDRERMAQVRNLYLDGYHIEDIADEVGLSVPSLRRIYEVLRLESDTARQRLRPKLETLLDQGLSDEQISAEMHTSVDSIHRMKWEIDFENNVIRLFGLGLSPDQIADQTNGNERRVRILLTKLGLQRFPIQRDELIRLHGLGKTDFEIAKILMVPRSRVAKERGKLGLSSNTPEPTNPEWDWYRPKGSKKSRSSD